MNETEKVFGTRQMDGKAVREWICGAPTARKRERWHGTWRMTRGMSAVQVAEALEWNGTNWKGGDFLHGRGVLPC